MTPAVVYLHHVVRVIIDSWNYPSIVVPVTIRRKGLCRNQRRLFACWECIVRIWNTIIVVILIHAIGNTIPIGIQWSVGCIRWVGSFGQFHFVGITIAIVIGIRIVANSVPVRIDCL